MAKQARLEARITPDVQALLKRAAEIEGRSLSDFVVSAARAAAVKTLEETEIIQLSRGDQEAIAAAILNPSPPSPALQRAIKRHARVIDRSQ